MGSSYDCFFVLEIKDNAYYVSVSGQLRYIKRYDYDYNFRIGEDGLWQLRANGMAKTERSRKGKEKSSTIGL